MILKIRWRPKLRDRIIYRIQDQHLREELPKIPDFDLQRYLSVFRAAKFLETRTKTLEEGVAVNSLKEQTKRGKVSPNKRHENTANKRRENDDRDVKDSSHREVLRCKFCGGKHRATKKSCSAFGKKCLVGERMNHFAYRCFTKTRVNVVESDSESEFDEYCLMLRSVNEREAVRIHVASDLGIC